jgi:GNAT superfamily N-acetyltransferase
VGNGLSVRPFEMSDLPQVLEVLRLSLGEPPGLARTPRLFAWKHLDNPFGRSLMLVAEEGGRMVGFRAFMQWQLVTPGGVILRCVRAVDTATHPDFQRRGIFRMLTLSGIDHASSEGIDLIFNTPNSKSRPGYLSMGWREIGHVGAMVRPSWRLLGSWRDRQVWAPAVDLVTHTDFDKTLAIADRPPRGLRTPRTRDYLYWRFVAHPTGHYVSASSAEGFALGRAHLRRGRRELVISELFGPGSPQAARSLRARTRPDYMVGWFSASSHERAWAVRSGMIPMPGIKALTLVARPLIELPVSLTWSNWDLSMGDLELL